MTSQFEERLRESLHARAADVTPDPRTWETVQRRIDRQRTFRFAAGAALAAAAIAAVVVVGPALLEGPLNVDLEPAPAEQPSEPAPTSLEDAIGGPSPDPSAPTGAASPRPIEGGELGFVTTDGNSLSVVDASGKVLATLFQYGEQDEVCGGEECGYPIQDFAVRPGDEPGQLTVVWRAGVDCGAHLNWLIYDGAQTMHSSLPVDHCPGTPVFSPDGAYLAWTEADAGDPSSFSIRAVEWIGDVRSENPVVVGSPADFGIDASDTFQINIDDWVWTGGTVADTTGFLALHGNDAQLRPHGLLLAIERQADGALAVQHPPDPSPWIAYASLSGARAVEDGVFTGTEYVVTFEEAGPVLTRQSDTDAPVSAPLPDEYLATGPARPWLSALGDLAVLGDGDGRAWRIAWAGDRWGQWDQLPGDVRFADVMPLRDGPQQGGEPEVEPLPAQEGLPLEVEEMRQAIVAAARTGNIDQLVMLTQLTENFGTGFGGDQDPRAFFTDLAERGELEQLATILAFPYGAQELEDESALYVWPYAHTVDDLNSLSSAQLQELEVLGSPEEVASWEEFGAYHGPRIGIDERGAWRFYILGGD